MTEVFDPDHENSVPSNTRRQGRQPLKITMNCIECGSDVILNLPLKRVGWERVSDLIKAESWEDSFASIGTWQLDIVLTVRTIDFNASYTS